MNVTWMSWMYDNKVVFPQEKYFFWTPKYLPTILIEPMCKEMDSVQILFFITL